jgi:uncharacterized Zn finger protein (UPF0148 family)
VTATKCPECGSTNILYKSGEWECMACGHKWKTQPTIKQLMQGSTLNGSIEAARVKQLDTFQHGEPKTEEERREQHGSEPPPRGTGRLRDFMVAEMEDERKAAQDYQEKSELAETLGYPEISQWLASIASDERRHLEILEKAVVEMG